MQTTDVCLRPIVSCWPRRINSDSEKVDPLDRRAFNAVLTHQLETRQNQQAYNSADQSKTVRRAIGLRATPRILWQLYDYYMDPFREEIKFTSIDEYMASYDSHLAARREAMFREMFVAPTVD